DTTNLSNPSNDSDWHFCWNPLNKLAAIGFVTEDGEKLLYSVAAYKNKLPETLEKQVEKFEEINVNEADGSQAKIFECIRWQPRKPKTTTSGNPQHGCGKLRDKLIRTKAPTKKQQRRRFAGQEAIPQSMSVSKCANFIKEKKVIFMTGAGISSKADIATGEELTASAGVSWDKPADQADQFVENLMDGGDKNIATLSKFLDALKNANPTPAHLALTTLARHKKTQVLTGNFDCLHEASGIKPYMIDSENIKEDLTDFVANKIDCIVCIGLSYDFQGILHLYKSLNPNGTIIAINKETQSYLGNEDHLVKGDIQEIVPEIARQITKL
ncbi:hypothetical protein HOD08_05160, partial [bacterium]|nr:hypothetical protein [bacterium]